MTGWSHLEGCFVYDCLFGCHGTDFESEWEAQAALDAHDCMHAQFPGAVRVLKQDGMP